MTTAQFEPGIGCGSCGGWMYFAGVTPCGDGKYICEDEFCMYSLEIDPESGKEVGTGW